MPTSASLPRAGAGEFNWRLPHERYRRRGCSTQRRRSCMHTLLAGAASGATSGAAHLDTAARLVEAHVGHTPARSRPIGGQAGRPSYGGSLSSAACLPKIPAADPVCCNVSIKRFQCCWHPSHDSAGQRRRSSRVIGHVTRAWPPPARAGTALGARWLGGGLVGEVTPGCYVRQWVRVARRVQQRLHSAGIAL